MDDKNHSLRKQKKVTNHIYFVVVTKYTNINKTLQSSNTLQILSIYIIKNK